jgi:carboxymethylenebutenolidase
MSGAVGFLKEEIGMSKIGSVGFCMGGALSLTLGTIAPVDAVVSFYGLPTEQQPDWSNLAGPVQGHFAERDNFFSPAAAKELFEKLEGIGKKTELHVYDGTDHGFFNDDNPGVHNHDAAELAWGRTLDFFRKHLS